MDKGEIRKILLQKSGKIAKLSSAVAKDFEPETLHKFRVEVKRLRSFLRLLATKGKQKEMRLPGKLKRLYDTAGIIRGLQLEQQKIKELKLQLPAYGMHLASQMQHQKRAWKHHYSKSFTDKLDKNIKEAKLDKIPAAILLQFLCGHSKSIGLLCKGSPADEDIHSIRKQLKDMLYNAKFVELKWSAAYKRIANLPLKELDELSESLGSYNDKRVWLEHFESYKPIDLSEQERAVIATFCGAERKLLQAKKKLLLRSVRRFVKAIGAVDAG